MTGTRIETLDRRGAISFIKNKGACPKCGSSSVKLTTEKLNAIEIENELITIAWLFQFECAVPCGFKIGWIAE